MGFPHQSTIFITLSVVGFCLVWGVMGLNGSLFAMLNTIESGVFPDGQALKKSWVGFWPIDFLICVLVVFFGGLLSQTEPAPYLALLDLVAALFVVNMMTLTESRRAKASNRIRRPALWQYSWNCGGVAVFLPIWALLYTKHVSTSALPLPASEAQALPFTALWSFVLVLPLLLPSAIGASSIQIQVGIVLFFLTPPLFAIFQSLVQTIISRASFRGIKKPVMTAYLIVGTISALIHVSIVFQACFSSSLNLSLERVFFPHYNSVQLHQSDIITNGALLFIQYDNVIMNLIILVLGIHIHCFEPALVLQLSTMPAVQFMLSFVSITLLLGPGPGLAFALYLKERRLSNHGKSRKRI